MNLDELKSIWQEHDQKWVASKRMDEKLIKSIIKEKSGSTLAKIRRDSVLIILVLTCVAVFCSLAVIYNAFDYQYILQYLPLTITTIASGLFAILMIKEYSIGQSGLNKENLADSLKKVIFLHEKCIASNRKLGLLIVSASILWPISNTPHMIERRGLLPAIGILVLIVTVQVLCVFVAYKAGAFKDKHGNQLRAHLQELLEFEE